MFQFSGLASDGYTFTAGSWEMTPTGLLHSEIPGSKLDWQLPEAYRSYSTSFVAASCQGIHQTALVT